MFGKTDWALYDAVRLTRKRRVRRRKIRATVFANGVWFTWDERGTGGENDVNKDIEGAKRDCEDALRRQGWMK
jgi:hypothetical protein